MQKFLKKGVWGIGELIFWEALLVFFAVAFSSDLNAEGCKDIVKLEILLGTILIGGKIAENFIDI